MQFSDRIGVTQQDKVVHLQDMPDALRNSLWNAIHMLYDGHGQWHRIATFSAFHFFKVPTDTVPAQVSRAETWLRDRFFHFDWWDVYNFIEFIAIHHRRAASFQTEYDTYRPPQTNAQVIELFNGLLTRERSGYRFLEGQLTPISDPVEIEAVERAIEGAKVNQLSGVREHLSSALSLLARRPNPDYRNSVKESISAVESATKMLSGKSGGGLANALRELAQKISIHPAQEKAFNALYGWTSDDAEGIRHSMIDASTVDEADARFMLVACSAFVNYLLIRTSNMQGHDGRG